MALFRRSFFRGGVTIRTYLLALVLAAVIPLGMFAAALLYLISSQQEAEMQRGVLERAKALSAAIDSNIDSGLKRMAVLANESALHMGDMKQFEQRCRDALSESPEWRSLLLSARDGTQLVNTLVPPSPSLPSGLGLPYIKEVFAVGEPVVSRLFIGRISKQPLVGLAVPVKLQGTVQYVLASGLNIDFLRERVTKGIGLGGGVGALLDQDLKYIARSMNLESRVGAHAPPDIRQRISASAEGVDRFTTEEGLQVVGAWSRLPHSGWTVWVASPLATIRSNLLTYLMVLGAISLIVAAAGAAAATLLARRMTRDVSRLAAEADMLASGARVTGSESAITELQALGRAHQSAGTRLHDLLERERQHRDRAEAENKSKDEFLAMLGHELRNPLGAISNAARALELKHDDPKTVRFGAEVITRQSRQLRRIIDDLLDVNRIISGKISLERRPLNLAEIVQNALAALAVAKGHEREIVLHMQPVWVEADPARIEQVVINLLSNAIAHTPRGGRITVEVNEESGTALIRVTDTGVGIPPEHLARIFELFYQVPQSLDRAKGGLGIGLTLVQRLVQLHDGSVSASSLGPDKGTTFTVRLPAVVPASNSRSTAHRAQRPIEPLRILLIEDDADSRESMKRILELEGHKVEFAADGRAGVAKVRAWKPDLAIVDIGLPLMNGYEVAQGIRREYGEQPLLVALTGYGRPEDEQRARRAGFDEHLVKPADFTRLLEIVRMAALRGD